MMESRSTLSDESAILLTVRAKREAEGVEKVDLREKRKRTGVRKSFADTRQLPV